MLVSILHPGSLHVNQSQSMSYQSHLYISPSGSAEHILFSLGSPERAQPDQCLIAVDRHDVEVGGVGGDRQDTESVGLY